MKSRRFREYRLVEETNVYSSRRPYIRHYCFQLYFYLCPSHQMLGSCTKCFCGLYWQNKLTTGALSMPATLMVRRIPPRSRDTIIVSLYVFSQNFVYVLLRVKCIRIYLMILKGIVYLPTYTVGHHFVSLYHSA